MSIKLGIQNCKASVYWYKHNNLDSLEEIINSVFSKLATNNKSEFKSTKFFMISESVFLNSGQIVDIKRLVIKYSY